MCDDDSDTEPGRPCAWIERTARAVFVHVLTRPDDLMFSRRRWAVPFVRAMHRRFVRGGCAWAGALLCGGWVACAVARFIPPVWEEGEAHDARFRVRDAAAVATVPGGIVPCPAAGPLPNGDVLVLVPSTGAVLRCRADRTVVVARGVSAVVPVWPMHVHTEEGGGDDGTVPACAAVELVTTTTNERTAWLVGTHDGRPSRLDHPDDDGALLRAVAVDGNGALAVALLAGGSVSVSLFVPESDTPVPCGDIPIHFAGNDHNGAVALLAVPGVSSSRTPADRVDVVVLVASVVRGYALVVLHGAVLCVVRDEGGRATGLVVGQVWHRAVEAPVLGRKCPVGFLPASRLSLSLPSVAAADPVVAEALPASIDVDVTWRCGAHRVRARLNGVTGDPVIGEAGPAAFGDDTRRQPGGSCPVGAPPPRRHPCPSSDGGAVTTAPDKEDDGGPATPATSAIIGVPLPPRRPDQPLWPAVAFRPCPRSREEDALVVRPTPTPVAAAARTAREAVRCLAVLGNRARCGGGEGRTTRRRWCWAGAVGATGLLRVALFLPPSFLGSNDVDVDGGPTGRPSSSSLWFLATMPAALFRTGAAGSRAWDGRWSAYPIGAPARRPSTPAHTRRALVVCTGRPPAAVMAGDGPGAVVLVPVGQTAVAPSNHNGRATRGSAAALLRVPESGALSLVFPPWPMGVDVVDVVWVAAIVRGPLTVVVWYRFDWTLDVLVFSATPARCTHGSFSLLPPFGGVLPRLVAWGGLGEADPLWLGVVEQWGGASFRVATFGVDPVTLAPRAASLRRFVVPAPHMSLGSCVFGTPCPATGRFVVLVAVRLLAEVVLFVPVMVDPVRAAWAMLPAVPVVAGAVVAMGPPIAAGSDRFLLFLRDVPGPTADRLRARCAAYERVATKAARLRGIRSGGVVAGLARLALGSDPRERKRKLALLGVAVGAAALVGAGSVLVQREYDDDDDRGAGSGGRRRARHA